MRLVPDDHLPTWEAAKAYGMDHATMLKHLKAAGVQPFVTENDIGQPKYWWRMTDVMRVRADRKKRAENKANAQRAAAEQRAAALREWNQPARRAKRKRQSICKARATQAEKFRQKILARLGLTRAV